MRVVIGEDEALLREGLKVLLAGDGLDVAGSTGDADELVELCRQLTPDVVVTDIRMPPGNADDGLRAALRIRAALPGTGVMVLSQFVTRQYAIELLGADPAGIGYLLKQRISEVDEFCAAVREVGSGGTVLDPDVVAIMLRRATRAPGSLDRLTGRQSEVLALIAEGRSNAAIAVRLGISEKGVVKNTSRIYDELGLLADGGDHRRVLAVIRFLTQGT